MYDRPEFGIEGFVLHLDTRVLVSILLNASTTETSLLTKPAPVVQVVQLEKLPPALNS